MVKFQSGKIILGFKESVNGEDVAELLRRLGLEFGGDFCVKGDFYAVKVPEGQELKWAEIFKKDPRVTAVLLVPQYEKVESGK